MFGYHDYEEMILDRAKEEGRSEYKRIIEKAKSDDKSKIIAALRTFPTSCVERDERIKNDLRQEGFFKGAKWAIDWIMKGSNALDEGKIVSVDIIDEESGITMFSRVEKVYSDSIYGIKKSEQ